MILCSIEQLTLQTDTQNSKKGVKSVLEGLQGESDMKDKEQNDITLICL